MLVVPSKAAGARLPPLQKQHDAALARDIGHVDVPSMRGRQREEPESKTAVQMDRMQTTREDIILINSIPKGWLLMCRAPASSAGRYLVVMKPQQHTTCLGPDSNSMVEPRRIWV